jgi:phosphoglycerate dehydrogenase-like enzyme
MAPNKFRVAITRDNVKSDGTLAFAQEGLDMLSAESSIEWEILPQKFPELMPEHAEKYDAIIVLGARVTAKTLSGSNRRLKLIARHGVGYDTVEVPALTKAGVLLTITPDGVRRPMATAAFTFVLALAQKMLIKDKMTREGRWNDKANHVGMGLSGRTLGSVGIGNIGGDLFRLAKPFDLKFLAHDPFASEARARELGVKLVDLPTLMRESDFVCVNCPLSEKTRGLIGARELGLMKPTAYIVNTARGPIIDEKALYNALSTGKIAGAGLDVFEQEPTPNDNPILKLANVIVAPHALGHTDEIQRGIARQACQSVIDVAHGKAPAVVVNREVLDNPAVKSFLRG